MTVTLLIGYPASGKSTYAKELAKKNVNSIILSSDTIRKMLYGDENIQGNPSEVFNNLYETMESALNSKKDIIIDSTNINRIDRYRAIDIAKKYNCEIIGILFDIPIEECKKRNAERERVVPNFVYDKMLNRFEEPTLSEGFDDLIKIKINKKFMYYFD